MLVPRGVLGEGLGIGRQGWGALWHPLSRQVSPRGPHTQHPMPRELSPRGSCTRHPRLPPPPGPCAWHPARGAVTVPGACRFLGLSPFQEGVTGMWHPKPRQSSPPGPRTWHPGLSPPRGPCTWHPVPGQLSPLCPRTWLPRLPAPQSPCTCHPGPAIAPRSPACCGVTGTPRTDVLLPHQGKNEQWKRKEEGARSEALHLCHLFQPSPVCPQPWAQFSSYFSLGR